MKPVLYPCTIEAGCTRPSTRVGLFVTNRRTLVLNYVSFAIHNATSIAPRYEATGPRDANVSDTRTGTSFALQIDRKVATPIGEQIYANLRRAIMEGVLKPGARLPSGRDLATQLGVARGTVRSAY